MHHLDALDSRPLSGVSLKEHDGNARRHNRCNSLPHNVLASSFRPASLQAVIWTTGTEPSNNDVLRLASTEWADRFDGDPVSLPTLPALPSGFPRLSLRSVDQAWRLHLAAHRLDLSWRLATADSDPVGPERFAEWASSVITAYIKLQDDIRVTRIAYVINRFARQDDPAIHLADYFIRPRLRAGPLNRPSEFQLHAHKVYQPLGMERLNSWVRWRTGTLEATGDIGITLEQDLNTPADVDRNYSSEQLVFFFGHAPVEADSILTSYLTDDFEAGK